MKRRWNSSVCIADLRKTSAAMQAALKACTVMPFEMLERLFSALELVNVSVACIINSFSIHNYADNPTNDYMERFLTARTVCLYCKST